MRPDAILHTTSPVGAPRLPSLQVLRFFAATLVLWYHWSKTAFAQENGLVAFEFGIFGVDLFFVLSGFVMALMAPVSTRAPLRFLARRILRIVPLYWGLTILLFGAVCSGLAPLTGATECAAPDLFRSLLFIPFEKSNGLTQPILFLGWTLNYEMFFYVLFALALCTPRPGMLLCLFLTFLVILGRFLPASFTATRFFTDPLILEFALGIGAHQLWQRLRSVPGAPITGGVFVGVGLAAAFLLFHFFPPPTFHRSIAFALPAVFIVTGGALLPLPESRITNAWVTLGNASFALYLLHPYVQKILLIAIPKTTAPEITTTLMLLFSFGVSVMIFTLFEYPLNRITRRKTQIHA